MPLNKEPTEDDDEELRDEAKKLQELYNSDLTDHLADQLVDFRSLYYKENSLVQD